MKTIYNGAKLRGRIAESGLRKQDVADKLGLSGTGFRNKLQGETEFVLSEIETLQQILHLNNQERDEIFFSADVS